MPPTTKAWVGAPSTATPLDAPALIGLEGRVGNYVGAQEIGIGAGGYEDFRVKQAGAGSMSVDVGVVATLMRAVLPGDGLGGTERYEYSGAQLNALIAAADATNPRIDTVTLAPQASVDTNVPQVLVVKGTATAGASLSNRNGAGVVPPGRIWLADVLVSAGASSILTAFIRDRRSFPFEGSTPPVYVGVEQITPQVAGVPSGVQTITQGTNDNRGAAVQFWLPKRILAKGVRWKYRQGATPAATTYQWFIFDAAGNGLLGTPTINFAGAAASGHAQADLFNAQGQLEAGCYYAVFAAVSMTAGSTVTFNGWQGVQSSTNPGVAGPNLYAFSPAAAIPGLTSTLQGSMTDAFAQLTDTVAMAVPFFTIAS